MKTIVKVIVILMSIMFMSGCSNDVLKERYEGVEFEYNGHSYIELRRYTGRTFYRVGTVHNPDCKCNNEK